jgi:hypothetical protein
MRDEHGVTLLESDMREIVDIVKEMNKEIRRNSRKIQQKTFDNFCHKYGLYDTPVKKT